MPNDFAAFSAFPLSRDAMATISLRLPFCIPGITFLTAMAATPSTPHFTLARFIQLPRYFQRSLLPRYFSTAYVRQSNYCVANDDLQIEASARQKLSSGSCPLVLSLRNRRTSPV